MDELGLKLPRPRVDIVAIRRKYYAAEREEKGRTKGEKAAKADAKGRAKARELSDRAAAAKA